MVCCALLSMFIAVTLLVSRYIREEPERDPLAWRLHGHTSHESKPARSAVRARLRSFRFAFAGLRFMLRNEANARIHLVATVLTVMVGLIVGLQATDWRWITAAVLWVWIAEALNTALEHLCNVVSPGPNDSVRIAKDVAAGAVLVSAVGAVVLGALTMMPYLAPPAAGLGLEFALCRATS